MLELLIEHKRDGANSPHGVSITFWRTTARVGTRYLPCGFHLSKLARTAPSAPRSTFVLGLDLQDEQKCFERRYSRSIANAAGQKYDTRS